MASGLEGRKPTSNNADASVLDWEAVRSCVQDIESGQESKDAATIQHYVRMQRLVWKHSNDKEMRDAVFSIASDFSLSLRQTIRLFLALSRLKTHFEFYRWFDDFPRDAAARKEVEGIQNSLRKLSSFAGSRSRRRDRALQLMEAVANEWANKQDIATLESLGFERIKVSDEFTSFGSHYVLRQWLRLAPLMHEFAKIAIKRLSGASSSPPFPDEPTAIVYLVGKDLPELYQKVVGQRFTTSREVDKKPTGPTEQTNPGKIRDQSGVRFVRMCCEAITGRVLEPETIASYRKEHNKWLKSLGAGR